MAFTQTAFSDLQPYLVLNQVVVESGTFPTGGADGDTIGVIYQFAGSATLAGSLSGAALAQGQSVTSASNLALSAVLGTRYGGNATAFQLPNLSGRLAVSIGTGSGLTEGTAVGSSTVTLTVAQMPTSSGPASTGFENRQPSLPIQYIVCTTGNLPSATDATFPFLGQIMPCAGNTIPPGWAACAGTLLTISSNAALFSILSTTYGGNGTSNFALPNLIGRVPVGFSATRPIGTAFGQTSTALTAAQIPVAAAVPGVTGQGAAVTNDQPSLSVEYLVATQGFFPSSGSSFDTDLPFLGEVVAFAGNFVPAGYALANGQTLPITGNAALFAVLGTTYGGNGTTTFALPNLTGRAVMGAGTLNGTTFTVGQTGGVDSFTLTGGNLPAADQICFLPGTRIQTPNGETPVERLAPGDLVKTFSGTVRPIVWVGQGNVLATRYKRGPGTPVIVRKGAFGPNRPHTDLRVTKGHAFFIDGVLIPVEFLVNHRSIEWDDRGQNVTVFHIELETHDVLVANGTAVESYRDDGNRWLFRNANDGWSQPPKSACAPILTGGSIVDAIWYRLLDRVGRPTSLPLTHDVDLHLLVDDKRIDPSFRYGMKCVFPLPQSASKMVVASRAASPAELILARDPRMLGVAVKRILLFQAAKVVAIEADDPMLSDGFHGFEPDQGHRWTSGSGVLPPSLLARLPGADQLVIELNGTGLYIDDEVQDRAA